MNTIISYLEQLELSELEAKLYLTLLSTGPTSVRDVAETIGIKRTTAYLYIDQLVEKGLVVKLVMGSQKQVAPNPPDVLKYLVQKKLESAKKVQAGFPNILKKINEAYPQLKTIDEAEITYYKGRNGVKKIYEEALQSKELRSYVNLSEIAAVFPENVELFTNIFERNKDLIIFEIVEDSPDARQETKVFSNNTDRYKYKFLPSDVKISSSDILIYDGKVSIINVRDKVSGVIFHNTDYYNLSRELFDFIWRGLPDA